MGKRPASEYAKIPTGFAALLSRQPVGDKEKDAYIQQLLEEVKNMDEFLALLRRKQYGRSSEQTPEDEQLGLFNEAEQAFEEKVAEPIRKSSRGWERRNAKDEYKLTGHVEYEDIQVEDAADLRCPECGGELEFFTKKLVREVPEFIPSKVIIRRYWKMKYICPACQEKDKFIVLESKVPAPLLNHSMASASVVSEVMYQKYVNAIPLYRQEEIWRSHGIGFSRTTMANWIIRCSEDWLEPFWDALHEALLQREVLHADETTVQVLKEPGRAVDSKSYMWVYRTGNDGLAPIILFEYRPGRRGEYAEQFLDGFHGCLHTDGYAGYKRLTNVTRCCCWAHVRRKFVEAMPQKTAANGALTPAQQGRRYCDQLFAKESEILKLEPEKRQEARLAEEGPILRAFWCWLDEMSAQPLAGQLKKAVGYTQGLRPYLENYLKDPRCQLSNNWAENAIRPFAVGRKNWLFSTTVRGAKASAVVYSIVETAKANDLPPREYLKMLLEKLPDLDFRGHPDRLEWVMPWGKYTQERFKKQPDGKKQAALKEGRKPTAVDNAATNNE